MKKIWVIEIREKDSEDAYLEDMTPSLAAFLETEELAKEYVEWYIKTYWLEDDEDGELVVEEYEDWDNTWIVKDSDGDELQLITIDTRNIYLSGAEFKAFEHLK